MSVADIIYIDIMDLDPKVIFIYIYYILMIIIIDNK